MRCRCPAGYAQILSVEQGPIFAQLLSAVMLGNIVAICSAGFLSYLGSRKPAWTGNGRLTVGNEDLVGEAQSPLQASTKPDVDASSVAAAGGTAIALYLVGVLTHHLFGWPAPVVMLVLVIAAQLFQIATRIGGGCNGHHRPRSDGAVPLIAAEPLAHVA